MLEAFDLANETIYSVGDKKRAAEQDPNPLSTLQESAAEPPHNPAQWPQHNTFGIEGLQGVGSQPPQPQIIDPRYGSYDPATPAAYTADPTTYSSWGQAPGYTTSYHQQGYPGYPPAYPAPVDPWVRASAGYMPMPQPSTAVTFAGPALQPWGGTQSAAAYYPPEGSHTYATYGAPPPPTKPDKTDNMAMAVMEQQQELIKAQQQAIEQQRRSVMSIAQQRRSVMSTLAVAPVPEQKPLLPEEVCTVVNINLAKFMLCGFNSSYLFNTRGDINSFLFHLFFITMMINVG